MQLDAISAVLCGAAKAGPGRVVKGAICQAGDSVGGPWDAAAVALRIGPAFTHSVQLNPSIVFNEITDQKLLATPRSTGKATASSMQKAVSFSRRNGRRRQPKCTEG